MISVQQMVMLDLIQRERVGQARYGTSLFPNNGRDALVDAYQEALDLACYLRQALAERGVTTVDDQPAPEPPEQAACRMRAPDETVIQDFYSNG